ncbi:MAG: alpha/beta fold hydrolase [Acidimicrobiia bacterium]
MSAPVAGRLAVRLWFTPFPLGLGRGEGVTWADETTSIGNASVHRVGEGTRRALLVHGWAGSSRQFRRIADGLVDAGFTVFMVDLPAHGSASGTTTDVPQIAEALGDVASQLGDFDLIVAHSLGAMATGVALADTPLAADRLVFVAPGIKPRMMISKFVEETGFSAEVEAAVAEEMESRFGKDVWDWVPARSQALKPPSGSIVIHDIDDDRVPVEEGRALADAWGVPIVETVGYGHNGVLRAPETIDAIVNGVVFRTPAARRG